MINMHKFAYWTYGHGFRSRRSSADEAAERLSHGDVRMDNISTSRNADARHAAGAAEPTLAVIIAAPTGGLKLEE